MSDGHEDTTLSRSKASLDYPFFPDSGLDSIDTICLRANNRDTWLTAYESIGPRTSAQFIRNQFAMLSQAALGEPATAGMLRLDQLIAVLARNRLWLTDAYFAGTSNYVQALRAAAAIGDDRLQKQTQGRVVPESFTHGSSEQRVRWFKRGMDSGRPKDCDTFSASSL